MKSAVLIISIILSMLSSVAYAEFTDQLIVKLVDINAQYHISDALASGDKLELVRPQLKSRDFAIFRWHASASEQLKMKQMATLRKHPAIKWVERDSAIIAPQFTPNDPLLSSQHHWQTPIKLFQAWDQQTDCSNIVVAVIDSGIDYAHPELQANLFTNTQELPSSSQDNDINGYIGDYQGWNAITDNGDVLDLFGHGTHVAGIIGAIANNNEGVAGVCWNVKILPVKFLNRFGDGSIANGVAAIHYVIDIKAQFPEYRFIINNSWAANVSTALVDALNSASEAGILLINAAGNAARNLDQQAQQPAAFSAQNVSSITVANANTRDSEQNFPIYNSSNYGLKSVTLAAPGVDIFSTWLSSTDTAYRTQTGTSMAAPIVSGVAALLWSLQPDLTASQLRAVLESTISYSPVMAGRIKQAGIVDAFQAISNIDDEQPLLAHLVQNDFVELQGEYLANIEMLFLENEAIAFELISDQRIRLQEPENLRCGTLLAKSSSGKESRLYLDWQPSTPKLTSLQWLNSSDAILSWQASEAIDFVEIQSALDDGLFSTLTIADNAQQFVRLNSLSLNSRLRIRGISACKGVKGEPIEVETKFSSALDLNEIKAPVWKTQAISEVRINLPYRIELNAANADSYHLQALEGEECFPPGFTLTEQGEIKGTATEAINCRFRVAALSDLSQQRSIQHFKLLTSDMEPGEQNTLSIYAVDDELESKTLEMYISLLETPIKAAALEFYDDTWTLNWYQDATHPLYELALEYMADGRFSALSWLQQNEQSQEFTGNIHNNYVSFIVDKENAYLFDTLEGDYQFRLAFNIIQSNQLISAITSSDRRCFIATSVYGNADHQQVKQLRQFRDKLLNNWPSFQPLVDYYYQHSPQWVAYMDENPELNDGIKVILKPILEQVIALGEWIFPEVP
jgi:subtilisin family serine protease